ncbi:dephospho-CoA kinase [Skermanella stibiiresistens SB22]|uniref:Dephospho-CoA kinase n=1 Tax=Skermanella stibiiresistens SB22 TaxID=1385369 RepID=W9H790_9PROT|nr:dephospho-CoA kinase [Skermanella stibiiresistens]EWY40577.1 dephospho-CoA kinase [Skermanella stibiiresistens SB22]
MLVLGLTGSIGMGKSTAARMLRRLGVPVHDSDATVHRLLARGGAAVPRIDREFPGVVRDGAVDRQALGAVVFRDTPALRRLEAILHPLVKRSQRRFLGRCAARRDPVAVLDIPLLFETGGERRVDAVIVVSAPAAIQRARVLARPGMTSDKLAGILKRQTPDREKRRRADFVVETGLGRARTLRALARVVRLTRGRLAKGHASRVWPPRSPFSPAVKQPHA